MEMADIRNYKTVQTIDGKSMVPYLKNSALRDNNRALIWNFPNDWAGKRFGTDNSFLSAIRQGDWKLLYFEQSGHLELYNVRKDIRESHDVAGKYPEKTRALARLLTEKLKACDAQLPTYRSTGQSVPWPDQVK